MGAFHTTNGGATWERWHLGLPETVVLAELTFVDRIDESGEFFVVAGTYGRGVWVREVGLAPSDVPDVPEGDGPDVVEVPDPEAPVLYASAPNPFREATTAVFSLPQAGEVSLRVFDVAGREVRVLAEGWRRAGVHRVRVAGDELPVGVLFLRLEAGGSVVTGRVVRAG